MTPAPLTRLAVGTSAEEIVLRLLWILLGDGKKDRGLMTRIVDGRQHVPTCQSGLWVRDGDSLRGGQPCSERCAWAHDAIDRATAWLKANETAAPQQLTLDEVAG